MREAAPSTAEILHIVRVTVEALTPLSMGSGDMMPDTARSADDVAGYIDQLARDANGLPMIAGSSIQGCIRHLFAEQSGQAEAAAVFGFADGDRGAVGRLCIGFGCVHDSHDTAIDGLVTDADRIKNDPVLRLLRCLMPMRRDHVALDAKHVVDEHKKFARLSVPSGTRFSVEFTLWGRAQDRAQDRALLERIVKLFHHPALRLGSGGRRGYGRIQPVRASYVCPDLNNFKDLRSIRSQPPSQALPETLDTTGMAAPHGVVLLDLILKPIGRWRVGGSAPSQTELTYGVRKADGTIPPLVGGQHPDSRGVPGENETTIARDAHKMATVAREPLIRWIEGKGCVFEPAADTAFDDATAGNVPIAIPGSAIKGPLAHRMLFHWHRYTQGGLIDVDQWLKKPPEEQRLGLTRLAVRPEPLEALLGAAKERDHDKGQASRLLVDDARVTHVRHVQAIDHNAIDAFTGGVRTKLLFCDEVLYGGTVMVRITILPMSAPVDGTKPAILGKWQTEICQAFTRAVFDLCNGRLAIGAKSLGYCRGTANWSGPDADIWKAEWDKLQELEAKNQSLAERAA